MIYPFYSFIRGLRAVKSVSYPFWTVPGTVTHTHTCPQKKTIRLSCVNVCSNGFAEFLRGEHVSNRLSEAVRYLPPPPSDSKMYDWLAIGASSRLFGCLSCCEGIRL